ncbi:hypothetical protein [Lysobacter gummosus]
MAALAPAGAGGWPSAVAGGVIEGAPSFAGGVSAPMLFAQSMKIQRI